MDLLEDGLQSDPPESHDHWIDGLKTGSKGALHMEEPPAAWNQDRQVQGGQRVEPGTTERFEDIFGSTGLSEDSGQTRAIRRPQSPRDSTPLEIYGQSIDRSKLVPESGVGLLIDGLPTPEQPRQASPPFPKPSPKRSGEDYDAYPRIPVRPSPVPIQQLDPETIINGSRNITNRRGFRNSNRSRREARSSPVIEPRGYETDLSSVSGSELEEERSQPSEPDRPEIKDRTHDDTTIPSREVESKSNQLDDVIVIQAIPIDEEPNKTRSPEKGDNQEPSTYPPRSTHQPQPSRQYQPAYQPAPNHQPAQPSYPFPMPHQPPPYGPFRVLPQPAVPNYSSLKPEEQEHYRAIFNTRLGKIRGQLRDYRIPDFGPEVPLETIHVHYMVYHRQYRIYQQVMNYRFYMLIGFAVLELLLGFFGFSMNGLTILQYRYIHQYDPMWYEIAERSQEGGSSSWPPELRIAFFVALNLVLFVVMKFVANKMGQQYQGTIDSIYSKIMSFFAGGESPSPNSTAQPDAPKPSAIPDVEEGNIFSDTVEPGIDSLGGLFSNLGGIGSVLKGLMRNRGDDKKPNDRRRSRLRRKPTYTH